MYKCYCHKTTLAVEQNNNFLTEETAQQNVWKKSLCRDRRKDRKRGRKERVEKKE